MQRKNTKGHQGKTNSNILRNPYKIIIRFFSSNSVGEKGVMEPKIYNQYYPIKQGYHSYSKRNLRLYTQAAPPN